MAGPSVCFKKTKVAHMQSGRGPSATCQSSEMYSNKCKTHERVGGEVLGQDRVVQAPTSNDANTALVVEALHVMDGVLPLGT